jgi:NAD(P)-dependent dehydrogenase (short-subunit alcohol dehydrogenase family)
MSKSAVILVTGASRGLGRGIAEHLAGQGYSIAINFARNASAADETVALCEAKRLNDGQRFLKVQADISLAADRSRMLGEVLEDFGRLDCLVNNAGIAPDSRTDIVEASEESYDKVMETNLKGPYFLTQSVARYWLGDKPEPMLSGGFCVIFVTSISAHTASTSRGEYCISKAGLSMAAQLWSARLAGDGIPVYELRPGIMESDMTAGVRDQYQKLIEEDGLVPQRRWGTGEDLGRAVASLVGGDFSFSTGSIIDVDGGLHIRRL